MRLFHLYIFNLTLSNDKIKIIIEHHTVEVRTMTFTPSGHFSRHTYMTQM